MVDRARAGAKDMLERGMANNEEFKLKESLSVNLSEAENSSLEDIELSKIMWSII
jgi:hypothetical protein